jgi:hypothetical protein
MIEVPLYVILTNSAIDRNCPAPHRYRTACSARRLFLRLALQGHLNCKKTHPPRTLPFAYTVCLGSYGVPRGGGHFFMGEVPL